MPVIESSPKIASAANEAAANDDIDDWPTTQRFSRHIGETLRGAEYAAAVERPAAKTTGGAALIVATMLAIVLLYAVMVALGQPE